MGDGRGEGGATADLRPTVLIRWLVFLSCDAMDREPVSCTREVRAYAWCPFGLLATLGDSWDVARALRWCARVCMFSVRASRRRARAPGRGPIESEG